MYMIHISHCVKNYLSFAAVFLRCDNLGYSFNFCCRRHGNVLFVRRFFSHYSPNLNTYFFSLLIIIFIIRCFDYNFLSKLYNTLLTLCKKN